MSFLGNSNFLQALGWAVLNSLWQMAFLWVVYQVILSFGVTRSAVKSRLAAMLLFTGFVWFIISLVSNWLISPETAQNTLFTVAALDATTTTELNNGLQQILPYASIAYLGLLILPVIQFIRNYRFVQIIRSKGLTKCAVDLRMFVKKYSERIGIRKPVHIYVSDLISSPVTIGFLKPIILVPMAAINNLTAKQMEAVLLHELAHIRRYDYFINLLVNFIRTILYYNPFVRLFGNVIEREREKSCDELVMQFEYDPHGYATALLVLEKNNFQPQMMAVAAAGKKNDLLNRIEKILGIEKRKMYDFRKLGGLLAGLLCIVSINALVFLSSAPVNNKSSVAINSISNPFYSLLPEDARKAVEDKNMVKKDQEGVYTVTETNPFNIKMVSNPDYFQDIAPYQAEEAPGFMHVGSFATVLPPEPELTEVEEEQVQTTVEATKKVLKEGQWKEVEKNVADALTKNEKELLKLQYNKDLAEVDWKQLENRLRLSYDQLNWDKINYQLSTAINNIALDSIQNVYTTAIENLKVAEKWMVENKVNSVPDTDVQLKEVKAQTEKLRATLRTVNAVKAKKIIRL